MRTVERQSQVHKLTRLLDWFRRQLFACTSEKRLSIDPSQHPLLDAEPSLATSVVPVEIVAYEYRKQQERFCGSSADRFRSFAILRGDLQTTVALRRFLIDARFPNVCRLRC